MLRRKSIKRLSLKFMTALLTFAAGVALTGVWFAYHHSAIIQPNHQLLSAAQAKEIIENSGILDYPKQKLLLLTTIYYPAFGNVDDPMYGILSEMGMIEITQIKRHTYKVQITEKGKAQNWAYGDNDWDHLPEARLVPIANQELSALKVIRFPDKDTCEVLFVWQWRANEIGKKLKIDSSSHECVIEIKRCGGDWCAPYEDASKRLSASESQP
jgi:hypothetical protein